jgi:predicted anti-sigma-YlaC factor YlaD
MMHPDELLASYLDGTLEPRERAEVDAHLAGCERCGADLRSATRARNELQGAPKAAVPPDLRERILAEAASRSVPAPTAPITSLGQARERRRPAPAAWLAGIAAAAALLIGFFVFSGLQTSSPTAGVADHAGAPEANTTVPGPFSGGASGALVLQPGKNYDEAAIQQLAAAATKGGVQLGTRPVGDATAAIACLTKGAKISGSEQPIELIQAKFGGKPAYLGVYRLTTPGEAPDRVEVWVVSKADCSVLSFAQQLIRN